MKKIKTLKKAFIVLLIVVLLSGCASVPSTKDNVDASEKTGAGCETTPAAENKTDEKKTEPVWQDEQTEEYAGDNKAATENDAPVTGETPAPDPAVTNEEKSDPDPAIPDETADGSHGLQLLSSFSEDEKDRVIAAQRDFAYDLLRSCYSRGEGILLSPASVQIALAMLQNGAKGETYAQIRDAVFGGIGIESFNSFYGSFDTGDQLKSANSLWLNSRAGMRVKKEFTDFCREVCKADVETCDFEKDFEKINGWVSEKTDGMIEKIVDSPESSDIAMLINALCFEADWATKYTSDKTHTGEFTNSDGTKSEVTMMTSAESVYLNDAYAEGFMKYYGGSRYAFAALLPEGDVAEYVRNLDAGALGNAKTTKVTATMPKFSFEYSADLSGFLKKAGMTDAFGPNADLSGIIGEKGDVTVSKVLQKTKIEVDTAGTKAAAASGVTIAPTAARPDDSKKIVLDRPFVYMIVDLETMVPVFIGVADGL